MHSNFKKAAMKAAIALAFVAPMAAYAESNIRSGPGSPLTASARLDFQITIPKVLFLQVGTGTNMAANATINQIAFTVPAANVGDSTVINATAGSGDLGNGQVSAKVVGNNGTITLQSSTVGALGNGAGDTISYADIATAVAANTTATTLAAPALVDASTASVTLTPASGKVINQDAKWTYTYKNTTVAAPGTYGGVNANNSRVTYTASMP
jgi:hypothetical protein